MKFENFLKRLGISPGEKVNFQLTRLNQNQFSHSDTTTFALLDIMMVTFIKPIIEVTKDAW